MRLIASAAGITVCVLLLAWYFRNKPPVSDTQAPLLTSVPDLGRFPVSLPAQPAATDKKPGIEVGIEVCGLGKSTGDPSDFADFSDVYESLNSRMEHSRQQWLTAILHSSDLRTRAVGLLANNGFVNALQGAHSQDSVSSLVQLATNSRDPLIYSIAIHACKPAFTKDPVAACQQINLTDWSDLDPDNAVPWLALAQEAHAAKDPIAEATAYARAATATRFDNYNWSLYSYVEPLLPAEASPLERYMLATGLVGLEAAMTQSYQAAYQHCSAAAAADVAVRSECSAVAELMVSKGNSLLDLAIGTSIGARVGWPADRVKALQKKKDAIMQLAWDHGGSADPTKQLTCDAINQANVFMTEWARNGALGAHEEELQRSGRTIDELAQAYHERQQQAGIASQ